jgi:hypothetical protein
LCFIRGNQGGGGDMGKGSYSSWYPVPFSVAYEGSVCVCVCFTATKFFFQEKRKQINIEQSIGDEKRKALWQSIQILDNRF